MSMHRHEAVLHDQEHAHMVHYDRHGVEWQHMAARHEHEHNHPAVQHDHAPHEDQAQEHLREGHIHDHAHPTTD